MLFQKSVIFDSSGCGIITGWLQVSRFVEADDFSIFAIDKDSAKSSFCSRSSYKPQERCEKVNLPIQFDKLIVSR